MTRNGNSAFFRHERTADPRRPGKTAARVKAGPIRALDRTHKADAQVLTVSRLCSCAVTVAGAVAIRGGGSEHGGLGLGAGGGGGGGGGGGVLRAPAL
eukprot:3548732-Pyramimonas_sp.AAC.1